ncbi:MAG: YdeN-like protein [Candidatus Berkelbacteria bacterium]|nr:YdeN-like protein [Candidatus Berkelbacteria bacterium]
MQMPKNILILHGWEGDPNLYWIPKAKKMFEEMGFRVFTPKMPGDYFPQKEEWLKVIKDLKPDKTWILIGHSLGGVAILNYLEQTSEPISQAILIATPFEPMKFTPIANFFENGFDWEKIRKNCQNTIVLNEIDDSIVPLEHGQKLAAALKVQLHQIPGGTHFHNIDLELLKGLMI